MIIQEGGPRRNTFSAEQSWGQKVQFDAKSNIPDHSTDDDKYPKGIGQKEAIKYLKGKLLPLH